MAPEYESMVSIQQVRKIYETPADEFNSLRNVPVGKLSFTLQTSHGPRVMTCTVKGGRRLGDFAVARCQKG